MENKNDSLLINDTLYETNLTYKFINRKKYVPHDPEKLLAFIPGTITEIFISEGDVVHRGQNLLILEAMKMKNDVKSPVEGKIKKIYINKGDNVMKNQLILEFSLNS